MSGHSKWSSIKHRKGAADAKKSKVFTKVIKEITVAARMGGEDPNSNPRLRSAITLAKSVNMPNDNVNKAIKKGVGADKAETWENITYEGYGPNNVAVIVECLTDNKNRTVSAIRTIFNKANGNIGATNSVLYMFNRLGFLEVEKATIDEEKLTEIALDAGADDIDSSEDDIYIVIANPSKVGAIQKYFDEKKVEVKQSSIKLVPQNRVEISDTEKARQVIKFIEALEDDDDVQNVYSNFDISDKVLKDLNESA